MGIPNIIPTYTNAIQVQPDTVAPSGGVGALALASALPARPAWRPL